MIISSLKLLKYRNFIERSFSFSPQFNFIYGPNGSGKSNLIEAIIFALSGKSPFAKKTVSLVNSSSLDARLELSFLFKGDKNFLEVKISDKKYFKINGKRILKLSDLLPFFKIVYFLPEDIILINGSPKIRRLFFDLEFSKIDLNYWEKLREYKKILKKRNFFLWAQKKGEKFDPHLFNIIDNYFLELNLEIVQKKISFLKNVNSYLLADEFQIFYFFSKKFYFPLGLSEIELKSKIMKIRKKTFPLERKMGYSMYGIHRDDFSFGKGIEDKSIFHLYSRGEKMKVIFKLKMAIKNFLEEKVKGNVVLIIDDFFNFFDETNFEKLLNMVKGNQVFFTSQKKIDFFKGKVNYYEMEK